MERPKKKEGKRQKKRSFFRGLHEVIIAETVIITIGSVIDLVITVGNKGDLSLSSLGLLVTLVSSTLLTHLLVASSSQSTSNLLDILARQLLDKLASKVLRPESVVGLLRLRGEQGDEDVGQTGELVLGGRLEERHRGEIDGVGRVGTVGDDNGLGGTAVAVHVDVCEKIRSVLEVGVLLGAAQAITALGLGLVLVEIGLFLGLAPALVAVLLYPLGLGLLVGGSGGLGLCEGLFGLLGLLALYFGVFSRVPGVEDLSFQIYVSGFVLARARSRLRRRSLGCSSKGSYIFLFLIVESTAGNGRGRRNAILLFICENEKDQLASIDLATTSSPFVI